jgi:hypothetical protein
MVVAPSNVFAPESVSAPVPRFERVPVPLITPLYVKSLLRLNSNDPLLLIVVDAIDPVAPPSPKLSVPAVIDEVPL